MYKPCHNENIRNRLNPLRNARSYPQLNKSGASRTRFKASAVTSRCTFPWPTGGSGSARRARKRGRKGLRKYNALAQNKQAYAHTSKIRWIPARGRFQILLIRRGPRSFGSSVSVSRAAAAALFRKRRTRSLWVILLKSSTERVHTIPGTRLRR